jgi:hypothetical protein
MLLLGTHNAPFSSRYLSEIQGAAGFKRFRDTSQLEPLRSVHMCHIPFWLYFTTLSVTQPVGMKGPSKEWQGSGREKTWSNEESRSASETFALLGYAALVGIRYPTTN